jgi:pimeloyl-ACP methyl ester carboxylesterase
MNIIAWVRRHRGRPRSAAGLSAMAISAAALAALAVAGPAGAYAGTAAPAKAGPTAAPPVLVLRWHACDGGFQCATARVPLDYRHPLGGAISLAVIRHLATGPGRRLGSLFFNSGGPAEQIQPFLASYSQIPAELRARFDIVSFDPRGFSPSTAITCFPTLAAEQKFLAGVPLFPVGHRQDLAYAQTAARFDAQCAAHAGSLLNHDSSADVARDMDLLRQAVGDPVLNFLGQSYATGLGAVYANLFPGRVGNMVFDGNVDPVARVHGSNLPAALRDREDVSDALTMRALLTLCGKATISACAFSAGTPAATRTKFAILSRRLLHRPVTIGSPAQTWTYADVYTLFPEYDFSAWPFDADVLQQLWLASAPGHQVAPGSSPVPPLPGTGARPTPSW